MTETPEPYTILGLPVVEMEHIWVQGRCQTCRWWKRWNDEAGECLRTITREDEPDDSDSKAVAVGAGAYRHVLSTRPDFGCVQWEGKDD